MLQPGSEDGRQATGYTSSTVALLGSLCLFLSAIEYLIPKPLPFMRIGLANLPLLLALNIFSAKDFFLLALIKVLGQGLIGGTLFSYVFLFSLAGTFTSAGLMFLLHRLCGRKYLGFAGLGCAGAMASNGVQLVIARYLIFGSALRYLIPPFLASGLVTGIALGLFCEYFCRRSKWYKAVISGQRSVVSSSLASTACCQDASIAHNNLPTTHYPLPTISSPRIRGEYWNKLFSANQLFVAGLLMALIFLFVPAFRGGSGVLHGNLLPHTAQFLFFCLLAFFSGKKNNLLVTVVFMAGIVFFNLLAPYGKVLASFGVLRITEGSLFLGLEKALILGGLLMLSRACIKSDLRLPGVGSLLGESFRMLELLREKKGLIKRGRIIGGIDRIMLEAEDAAGDTFIRKEPCQTPEPDRENTPQNSQKWGGKGIILLILMVIFTVVLAVFTPQ